MKSKNKRRTSQRTAFVPRIVFQTLFAGMVPAVAVGCASTANPDAQADATDQGQIITLAVIGFDADAGQDATHDSPTMGVADTGFDAGPPDFGVIVLAQIGFEMNTEEQSDKSVATAPSLRREDSRRTPRRGRA